MPPKKNATPAKQPNDSSVTFDESEDMSFQLSQVEGLVKGSVSKGELDQCINKLRGDLAKNMKGDLANLQVEMAESMEKNMGNMEKKLETNMGNMEKKLETNMGNMEKKLETNMGNMEKKLEESMETNMGNMEKKMEKLLEESMERIINLIQHTKEKLPNDDNVGQGTHDERNSSHFEKPSFSKSTPGGFDSNTGSNKGWFPRGIQLPKIE